jgi:signal transduction histidine kinase
VNAATCDDGRLEAVRPPKAAMVASTVAIGVLAAAALWGATRSEPPTLVTLDLVVAVASCALVPLIMRWPVVGGVTSSVLVMLSPVATPTASFAALYTARRRRFPEAAVVGIAGVVGQAVQGWWRPFPGLSYGWWLLLMTAAYGALLGWGTWAQARQALLAALRERVRRAEAEQGRRVSEARIAERARIAREMHDVLAHRLSLLATYAGALEYRPDASPQRQAAAAGVIRASAHLALDELREVITLLRRDETDAASDAPAGPGLSDLPRLIGEAQAAGQNVRLDDQVGLPVDAPPVTGRTAYRIVQEALTNARKHAAGLPAVITLTGAPGSRLTIEVRNPMSPTPVQVAGAGTGLVGLTERVNLAGGQLDHQIDAAGQFRLCAWLPWPA